jgi:hypothetical protein
MLNLMLSTFRGIALPTLIMASSGLVVVTGSATSGCKSGGSSASSGATTAGFESAPKRGVLTFSVVPDGAMGQTIGEMGVAFTEVDVSDAGPDPNLDGGARPDCEPVAIGPCVVTSCVQGTPIGGGNARSVAPAGTVTISDTTSGASRVFTATSGNNYQDDGHAPATAKPGDSITFTAAGGEVPGFTQTLTAPQPITPSPITCQDASVDASSPGCSISRSRDLTVTWSGGDHGNALVVLQATGAGCNNVQSCPPLSSLAACRFDVAAQGGVIPKDVLARFPESSVQLSYSAEDLVELAEGDYLVRISAATLTQQNVQFGLQLSP